MHVVATTPVSAREELRVVLDAYKGHPLVHARRYYMRDGAWLPGKGLAVPTDLMPWFVYAVQLALAEAVRVGDTLPEDFTNAGLTAPPDTLAAA
jgi:hypothetical protein